MSIDQYKYIFFDFDFNSLCLTVQGLFISNIHKSASFPISRLPLLIPMSEVAGRMATQEGAKYLEKPQGGLGILLGFVLGATQTIGRSTYSKLLPQTHDNAT